MAAWLAVCVTIAALVYAWRQFHQAKEQGEDLAQPNVAMFMEPSASDWHLIELVVKNFGQKPAYGIKFDSPPRRRFRATNAQTRTITSTSSR